MNNNIPLLSLPVLATAAITACRFVGHDGAPAAAAANALGVSRSDAAVGERTTVDVIGTGVVEAGGAITAGALVEVDASGRAVTKASGVAVARLAPGEVATAAGQFVEVILLPN